MSSKEKITAKIERAKPYIWGLFLVSILFKFAVSNIYYILLALVFFIQIYYSRKIKFDRRLLPIVIYFGWGVLSLFWTSDVPQTIKGITILAPLLTISLFISQYNYFTKKQLITTIKTFGVGLLCYFIIGLINASVQFLQTPDVTLFFYHPLVDVFKNNAIYISLAVALCLLVLINIKQKSRWDLLLLFGLTLYLILLSSKNISISTLFLAIIPYMVSQKLSKRVYVVLSLLLLLAVTFFFIDNPIKTRFLHESSTDLQMVWSGQDFYNYHFNGTEIRLIQYRFACEMYQNDQLGFVGLGLHNINYLLEQYFSYYNVYKGYFFINFHNQYLQTIGELGFVGFVLLLFIFFNAIKIAKQTNNWALAACVLLFIIAFLTESFLSRQKGVLIFIVFYTVFLHIPVLEKKENKIR